MDFKYAINANSSTPVLQINQHIGYDKHDGQGIDGVLFSREVFELDCLQPKNLTFYVNCSGGDVKEGFDIFNAIDRAKARTKVYVSGFAYSTGGWCHLSADYIESTDHSIWMCHLPSPMDSNEPAKSALVENVTNSIAKIIADKSGRNSKAKMTVSQVKDLMRTTTFLTAEDLYNYGLIDRVTTSSGKAKKFNNKVQVSNIKSLYEEYTVIYNKFVNDSLKSNTMSLRINNRLKIAEDSTEQEQLEAIARIENRASVAETENAKLSNKAESLTAEVAKLTNKVQELSASETTAKTELSVESGKVISLTNKVTELETSNQELNTKVIDLQNREKEAEEAAHLVKAETLINSFIKVGKIENKVESKDLWVKRAVKDYDDTNLILSNMPVNMHVPIPSSELDTPDTHELSEFQKIKMANKHRVEAEQKERLEKMGK